MVRKRKERKIKSISIKGKSIQDFGKLLRKRIEARQKRKVF